MHVFLTPGTQRFLFVRRLIAAALVVLAVALITADTLRATVSVVAFTRDLAPGHRITHSDIQLIEAPASLVPRHSLTTLDDAIGKLLISAQASGSMATTVDFFNPVLDEFSNGSNDAIVPITLANPSTAAVLAPGDRVDVIAAEHKGQRTKVLATNGVIIFIATEAQPLESVRPGTLLVQLPQQQAQVVASASLSLPLTVIAHREIHKQ